MEIRMISVSGEDVWLYLRLRTHRDSSGRCLLKGIMIDVTQRVRADEALRQTQKLESIGILVGGIAHDFSNLLTGILGNTSLAIDSIPDIDPTHRILEDVLNGAQRGAELTRQLLAYVGRSRFMEQEVHLSQLVRDVVSLIASSIPKNVTVQLNIDASMAPVVADPSQLQQLMVNLVVNAVDAIGETVGTVVVRTHSQQLEGARAGVEAGNYAVLEVSDSGCGIDKDTLPKIFEPFFTTKFTGRGLGLAAASGIVRAHHGGIEVESESGVGSTFVFSCQGANAGRQSQRLFEPKPKWDRNACL